MSCVFAGHGIRSPKDECARFRVSAIDLSRFQQTPLRREPFEYLIVSEFIKAASRPALHEDFPVITRPGSFPVGRLHYGTAFASLLRELHGTELRDAFEHKF